MFGIVREVLKCMEKFIHKHYDQTNKINYQNATSIDIFWLLLFDDMILRPLCFTTKNATVRCVFLTQAISAYTVDSQGIQFSMLFYQKMAAFSPRYHTPRISRRLNVLHIYPCSVVMIHAQFELIWRDAGCEVHSIVFVWVLLIT